MPATGALQQHRAYRPGFVMPASRTTKTLRPAELTQILPTGLLVGETRLDLGQIPRIIFHFPRSYILWSPESSEYPSWLKGIQNGIMNEPPVHVFVMGENQWHAERDWPLPQTQWTKYYFSSDGHANSLDGDGILGTNPSSGKPYDAYRYDPATPTPSPFTGGHIDGPVDTREAAAGDEVLVYTTPPLEEPIEVTGPISAKLYASTSARTARLSSRSGGWQRRSTALWSRRFT